MWFDIPILVITTMLSFAGVGVPQLNLEVTKQPVMSCAAESVDSCLANDVCDVFLSTSGEETCNVACDMRNVDSCTLDSGCAVVDGVCDYADHAPVGC